jgi:hypothetical protein
MDFSFPWGYAKKATQTYHQYGAMMDLKGNG